MEGSMSARTSVVVEVGLKPVTIMLERHQSTLAEFFLAHWSHCLNVVGRRGFSRDEAGEIAQLGQSGAMVQAALTENPLCAWIDDGQPNTPWLHRPPVVDTMWYKIFRDGHLPALKKIVSAYLSLFPEA
jgi:hypothetical protein